MEQIPVWISIVAIIVLVIEYILGKTKWIEPNSILETIFAIIVKIGKALLPKS